MRTRTLRRARLSTVGIETFSSRDGQGAPTYAASQNIRARDVLRNEVVKSADGVDIKTSLTLWVPGNESPLPSEQDRVTVGGVTYIVVQADTRKKIDGTVNHVTAKCREE